ncbi:MAG TPA: helix-turn-helix transcriptional regulator [bacterium]|nr:helix-turn-helix transcriptional regulator [bacterium]
MDFYQRIGARLRALRLREGLSQAGLGARLGLTAGAINRYEAGRRRVPLKDLPRIASILRVTPATLLGTERPGTRSGRRIDQVREEAPAYGRRRSGRGDVEAYVRALSPARLRALARRAGLADPSDPAVLRRYAALIAKDFSRRRD